jgi:hypothetical protein
MTTANRLNENLGRLAGSEVSFRDEAVQAITKKNADGSINFQAFYGRRNISLNINSSTLSYNVWHAIKDGYLPGNDITVTVAPTVTIGSTGAAIAALSVPADISAQDTVTIINQGTLRGAGGNGGGPGGAGVPGGAALLADRPITLLNTGTLIGGGGGGGGGNPGSTSPGSPKVGPSPTSGGGGGGGAGLNPGPASPGTAGTLLTGGAGGGPGGGSASGGGAGGPIGTAGTASGGAGGLAGRAIQGTSNVTLARLGQPNITVANSNLVSLPSSPIIGTLI